MSWEDLHTERATVQKARETFYSTINDSRRDEIEDMVLFGYAQERMLGI
jgi:hypothetical protein